MGKPLISVKNISLIRDGKKILDNISLEVNCCDNVTIIGANGAGKTMLLKAILGLEKINSGSVIRKKNLRIGYMPQRFYPNQLLPINVLRFLQLMNKKCDIQSGLASISIDISNLLNSPLAKLSGGEMQRVLLVNSLLSKPDILILDEPAQNLDISGQLKIYHIIEEISNNNNYAILMVSHNLHVVMRSASKVVCLFHHICCTGTPEDIIKHDAFASEYGNDMDNILAYYPHIHTHSHKG